jgi:tetraacyldisaccharide 4'-kinase
LERGTFSGRAAVAAAAVWERLAASRVVRQLRVPSGVRVISVGGATLGGSWKTPLAVACAKYLAASGQPVALVGHAYRARPVRGREVQLDDDVTIVGDEALACARELAGTPRALVFVGPTRQDAFDRALQHAACVVLDGALQIAPAAASLSVLSVDARAPWGAQACPPRGDLAAPTGALVSACDCIVAVGEGRGAVGLGELGKPVRRASVTMPGASLAGRFVPIDELRDLRIGIWTRVARASRLHAALQRAGLRPAVVVAEGDHHRGPPVAVAGLADVDMWLCTRKCHASLGDVLRGRPVGILEVALGLDHALKEALGP